jgi:hypothetical protein
MTTRIAHRFRVTSRYLDPGYAAARWDCDYAGSIASALRHLACRVATGEYSEVSIQRMRVTKTRERGSRRFVFGPAVVVRPGLVRVERRAA